MPSPDHILIVVGESPLPKELIFDKIVSVGNSPIPLDPRIGEHFCVPGNAENVAKWGLTYSLKYPTAQKFTICGTGEAADDLFEMFEMIAGEDQSFAVARIIPATERD